MKIKIKIISSVSVLILVGGVLGAAPASAHTAEGAIVCARPQVKIYNKHSGGTEKKSPNSPKWRVSGKGPGTLSINNTVGVSHSVSVSASVSKKLVSAAVGYDVTWSSSTSTGYSITLKKGEKREIITSSIHEITLFNWKKTQRCPGQAEKVIEKGTGNSKKFVRLSYHSRKA